MKNLKERKEVIEYSIKLNTTNLSPLRSGNISIRGTEGGIEGFFITPSGKKYESLKPEDIVFLSIKTFTSLLRPFLFSTVTFIIL